MCTSYIHRGKDTVIAMNFDNNGMKFSVDLSKSNWFVVTVDGGRGKTPSFGVSSSGIFFNHLMVDSNGKGLYKRASKKVTHTAKLITDILNEAIAIETLDDYLSNIEVVNTPDLSCHNMICDSDSNTWIVEPGRGYLRNTSKDSSYFVMTNFSIIDHIDNMDQCECERYKKVVSELEKRSELSVEEAFKILESPSQNNDDWRTELSIVFSKKDRAVYYCREGNYQNIEKHEF